MAKITFSNGKVVEFDGTPTQADIDEIASKFALSTESQPQPQPKAPLLDRITQNPISKGIQSFFPGAKLGEAIGTSIAGIGQALKGNLKGAQNIAQSQVPTSQVAGDVANVLLTAGGAALPVAKGATALSTIGKTALQGGILGGAQSGSKAISQGATAKEAGQSALIGGATSAAVSGTLSAFGELLKASGSKIVNTVIKPSQHDVADGFSMETIKKNNLGGSLSTMNQKTEARMNELSTQLAEKLKGSTATVDLNDAYEETVKSLTGNKLKTFGSNTSMGKALEQLKAEIADAGGGAVSIPDAQVIKQASGKMGAWQFGATDPDSTAREKIYNAFYSVMKNQIEKNSPAGVKEINKQLSELIPVNRAILRRLPIAERNNLLSLQDIITLTAGAMNPNALGGFALSLAQKSGATGNALMKIGTGVSKAAPVLGQAAGRSTVSNPTSSQSQVSPTEISQYPTSPDITTFSPEVQRILNMQQ